jgi:predicted lysophospholipase L1 biosynthesis ABC-type transport system permease subunit
MKVRMYWTYATRSLARGGQRTLLAIFCVAVGVMAVVALQLVGNAVEAGLTGNIQAINGGDVSLSTTSASPLDASDLSYFDSLKAQGTITGYTAVDRQGGQLRTSASSLRTEISAVNPARFPLAGAPDFTSPANTTLSTALQGDTIVITTPIAQALNLSVGDSATLSGMDGRSATVTVAGIIQSAGYFQGRHLLIALDSYSALASSSSTPLTYDEVYMNVPGHTNANDSGVQTLLQSRYPLASINTTQQVLAQNQQNVDDIRHFLQIVGLLALLIGGVGIINTMQVVLSRRRVEIAMLKTAGYRRRDLYTLFGLETGLIGMAGGVIGAAVGVGVSFFVKTLMENSFQIALPTTIDPVTVGAGVAVGLCTALIFGILPIVQASAIRPQAVLREVPEGTRAGSALLSVVLVGLLVTLFFALALVILQNTVVALGAVGGTGVLLALLGLAFGLLVLIISKLPVVESFRWWYALLVLLAVAASAALTYALPALGVLFMVPAALGVVVVLLPRTWKTNLKLALRNLDRQRARTVTTMLALFIGVFAIGLVLVLGQNLRDQVNAFAASAGGQNSAILASTNDKAAVDAQLAQTSGVSDLTVCPISGVQPATVNGEPIAQVVQAAAASGKYKVNQVLRFIDGVQGYDLSSGQVPNPSTVKIVQGAQDAQVGQPLTAADAGTGDMLLPVQASQAPLDLKVGDTLTVVNTFVKKPVTLTVTGFFTDTSLDFEPMLVDSSVVNTLTHSQPQYAYLMHLDPASADVTLAKVEAAVPGIQTQTLSDVLEQITTVLNNVILLLVAIASLSLLAALITIANAVALAMLERRREIGILKSVGHTSRSVLGEVLIENGILGYTGGVLAMIFVALTTLLLSRAVFDSPLSLPLPLVVADVAGTCVICMAVACVVAWRATRVRPLEVLRYE